MIPIGFNSKASGSPLQVARVPGSGLAEGGPEGPLSVDAQCFLNRKPGGKRTGCALTLF